jgi:hypothetical protein
MNTGPGTKDGNRQGPKFSAEATFPAGVESERMGVSMRNPALCLATLFLSSALCLTLRAQTNESTPQPANQSRSDASASQQQSPELDSAKPSDQAEGKKSLKESEDSGDKGKTHLRLGTVWLGAAYSHYRGPYYPYGPYGFYPGDWVYASLWHPIWSPYPYYPAGYFDHNDGRGEIRLTADPKMAEVYIDGAYAGTADRLKSMWLDPGAYDLTVSASDRESFHQRVYVLSGKSLKITAKLNADSSSKEKL